MKKMNRLSIILLTVLFTVMLANTVAFCQEESKKYVVPEEMLTESQKQQLKLKEKIDTYGPFFGIGTEIGSAVDGFFTAVESHADKIGGTKVGTFALILIAYKIIGTDIIQFIIGFPLFITLTWIFIWLTRKNCIVRSLPVEFNEKGGVTKYREYRPSKEILWGHFIAYLICLVVCAVITFV